MTSGVKPLRLVLADDHALVLEGLRALIASQPDMRVVATASDGERLLDAVKRFSPDVVVVDFKMPYLDGPSCIKRLRADRVAVKVLVLTALSDGPSMREALDAGADGYVLKTDPPEGTVAAIREVAAGHMVFPQGARRWLAQPPDIEALSARESEILELLAEGRSNVEIGKVLNLSANTVKFHLRNIYEKLGVANRTEAAAHYHRR